MTNTPNTLNRMFAICDLLDGEKIRFLCRKQFDGPEDRAIETVLTIQANPFADFLHECFTKGWTQIDTVNCNHEGEFSDLIDATSDTTSDIGRSLSFAELAPREQNTFCALIKWLIDMSNNKAALVEIDDMKALFTTKK